MAIVLPVALAADAGRAQAAAGDRLAIVGDDVELQADAARPGGTTASLLLALDTNWPAALHVPRVLALTAPSGQRLDPRAVSVRLTRDGAAGQLAKLSIDLEPAVLLEPGSYRVSLLVEAPPASAGAASTAGGARRSAKRLAAGEVSPPKPLRLTVTLKQAEAKLSPPPALVFDPWHSFRPEVETVWLLLPLSEVGGHAKLEPTIAVASATGPDAQPIWPNVRCEAVTIAAGQSATARCGVAPDFLVGTSKLKLLVRDRALAAPVEVSVEVQRRLGGAWIMGMIMVGLGIGYLVRVALATFIRYREARASAAKVQANVEAKTATADATFRSVVEPCLEALIAALNAARWWRSSSNVELANATTNAAKALDDAVTDLAHRRAVEALAITDLRRLTAGTWILPSELTTSLRQAEGMVEKADAELKAGHLTESQAKTKQANELIQSKVTNTLQEWSSRQRTGVALLAEKLPIDLRATKAGLDLLGRRTSSLTAVVDAEHLVALLSELTSYCRSVREELNLLAYRIRSMVEDSIAQRLARAKTSPTVLDALRQLACRVADRIDNNPSFEVALEAAPSAIAELEHGMTAAILKVLEEVPETARAAVTQALDDRRFVDAAREAAKVLVARSTGQEAGVQQPRILGKSVFAVTQLIASRAVRGGLALGELVSATVLPGAGGGAPPVTTQPRTMTTTGPKVEQRNVFLAKAGQLVVLGILTVATGYFLLDEKFFGRPSELAAIFGWSFAIDLSTDVVTNLVKSLWKV